MSHQIPDSFLETAPPLRDNLPAVTGARHVRTDEDAIERVASWLAYEEFVMPGQGLDPVAGAGGGDREHRIDVAMLMNTLNFAFTDFASGRKFEVVRGGRTYSDSEAMFVRVEEALARGVPMTDGRWMAEATADELDAIFQGSIRMPMLDERARVLNEVGVTLSRSYAGRFSRFIDDCPPRLYDDGAGMLERLLVEFPRFDDVSDYHGHTIRLYKLAQLGLWSMHAAGLIVLEDLHRMTAFADYIVPVALRLFGVFEYSAEIEARIGAGEEIPRDSEEEVEIRAHSLHATALMTEAVNRIRPEGSRLVIPQLDYRLWKTYHATFWPHHLTRTVMY